MQSLTNIDGHQPDAIRVAHDVNQAMFDVLTQPLAFHLVVRAMPAARPRSRQARSPRATHRDRSTHAGRPDGASARSDPPPAGAGGGGALFQDEQLQGLGFGCKLSLEAAAVSAYLELCQMELSITLARHRASAEDEQLLRWMRDITLSAHLTPDGSGTTGAAREPTFDDVVQRLRSMGLRTYAIDLQRADIGVPAVRLFVPGLCHYKPRLGHRRLVEVPKTLGWKLEGFGAADRTSMPLLI